MTDSSNYSSLFELVDSHLSKISIQNKEENASSMTSLNIPSLSSLQNGGASESSLPLFTRPRMAIPTFGSSESPIQTILAQQIANMLIAKEKKQQEEEKQKLEEEMKRLEIEEEESTVIDLMKAIQTPYNPGPRLNQQEPLSNSSSMESLLEKNFAEYNSEKAKTPEPLLPCVRDMSYVLKKKIKTGKPSTFAKVMRLHRRPVAVPYLRDNTPTNIKIFDFSTPSPCDIIKESRVWKPTMSCTFKLDITKFV